MWLVSLTLVKMIVDGVTFCFIIAAAFRTKRFDCLIFGCC